MGQCIIPHVTLLSVLRRSFFRKYCTRRLIGLVYHFGLCGLCFRKCKVPTKLSQKIVKNLLFSGSNYCFDSELSRIVLFLHLWYEYVINRMNSLWLIYVPSPHPLLNCMRTKSLEIRKAIIKSPFGMALGYGRASRPNAATPKNTIKNN